MSTQGAFRLSVLVVASIAGCSPMVSSPMPVAAAISQTSEGIDYGSWSALTSKPIRVPNRDFADCVSTPEQIKRGPHYAPAVKVFANPIALSALQSEPAKPLPVGSVVVKEKWWDEKNAQPSAYAAMVKRNPGYDSEHGDWEYVYAQLDGKRNIERGKLAKCIACHQGAASQDYLFRSYLSFDQKPTPTDSKRDP
jgi:hypothetical protein